MAGLGKSQLAIEYARKYHSDIPYYSAVFWVDATNQKSVEDSFSQIANVARPGKCPQSTTAKIAFVKKFLKERNENWLLIFDNYDDLSSFDHIRSFFPQGHAGHILVTSRTSGSDPLGTVIPLGPMNSDDAVRLLFRRSHENPVEQHRGHTEKIVHELGCLPLAIDQAGAFIWSKRLSPCDFLGYYASQKETVFRCTPDLRRYCRTMEETGQDLDGTLSVFTTLELSFRQIARSTEEEESGIRQLLLVSAFLDRSNIPETLFKRTAEAGDLEWQWAVGADRTWDSAKFQSAMETLSNLSLIQGFSVTKDTAIFSLHPLVQVWAKLRLETAEQSAFTLKAVSLVASFIAADRNNLTPGDTKRNMLLHVDACAKNAREFLEENSYFVNENLVDAAETFGWFYDSHGRYNDSAEQYERAVDVSTKTCGPEHVATLRRIEGLALVRRNQGQYAESDRLYRFALRAREKSVGFKHPEVLWTVHQLGIVTRRLGRYAEAEELYRRALAGNEERLGRDNVETLRTAEGLAIVKLNRGHFAEAEAIYMSAFYACGAQLGPSHLETLRKAEGAAIAKRHRGKYREAEQLHRCALQAREKHLGPVHPETLKTVHNLALTQRMRGFLEIALDLHSRALEGSQEQLGPEHPETLRMMEGLGVANRLLGHHDASHELLSYALHFSEEQLGRHHPDTLRKAESLANLHLSLSQFTEALQLHRRAYETFKRDLEARHPATLRAGNNLAVSLFKLGYLEEAESICTEALGDREAALDGDVADPDVLVLMHNLAAIKSGVGRGFRAEEAKELSAKVLVAIGQAKEECVYFPLMTKTQDLIVLEPC
jgi:tetratricopeptide (TPR) repeat protein